MSADKQQRALQIFMRAAPLSKCFDEFYRMLWSRDESLTAWRPRNALATLSGLLGSRATDIKAPEEAPQAYTEAIATHPVYKWLTSSEAFVKARQAFSTRSAPNWLDRERGELSFLRVMTVSAWHASATHGTDWKPPAVSTEERKRALQSARELRDYVKRDLRVANSFELERHVSKFCSDLEQQLQSKVRDYSDDDARERYLCVKLGEGLAKIPGLKNEYAVDIVEHFAELCGLTVSERSASRFMTIARNNLGLPKLRAPQAKKPSAKKAARRS